MTNDIMQRNHLRTGVAASPRASWKERAGAWRRRRLVFDFLESRRLLSTNVAEFPINVEGGTPVGIASGAGSDKNVWFTLSSNNIGMINPNDTAAGVTQYPIPTDNSGVGPIAAGPDGNYWFFEETADQFGVINPSTGKITEIPLLSGSSAQVDGITAGPNGYVWFTANGTSQIGAINTTNDQITVFSTSTPSADPYGIVEGPDGNIWFTEAGTNKIGMINTTTHAMEEFPIDSSGTDQAEGITVGPDGNLWVTLTGTDKIAVMSPSTGALLHEYPVKTAKAAPSSITVGPDRNLWFTESAAKNVGMITTAGTVTEFSTEFKPAGITSISGGDLWFVMTGAEGDTASENEKINSISPSSHDISSYDYTATLAGNANGIVSDSNGNLWFTQETYNQVGELNPTTGITTEYTSPTPNSGPLGIALGSNGDIYYTEHGESADGSNIGVVDTSNGTIEDYPAQTARSDPYGIVDDPLGGDLWFTEEAGDNIGRFDPETHAISEFSIPTANSEPEAITVDSSGNIWFTEFNAAQIGYLSPNSPTNIQSYPVAYAPEGIAFDSNGNIWVSEENIGSGLYYLGEYNASNGALIHQYALPSGHDANALTQGPDGDVWFADSKGNIGTLTSSGTFTFYPATHADPVGITSPADGNIWFTATGTDEYPTNVIGVVTLSSTSDPTQLAVTTQPPGSVTATDGFGMVVAVENSAGARDIDYTGTVTIALANNPGGDTLKGTLTSTVNQGVAVFSGLTLEVPKGGYTITATASGLSSTTTDEFNVTLGASQLLVTSQPPDSVQAGTTFSITVSAEDGLGNVDTSYNSAITLTLGNANGAALDGVLVLGANDGVATFTGLSLNQPGDDYVILASSGNLTSATSNGFDVTTGPPYQLVVANGDEPPSSVVAGATFALTMEAEDQFGDEATSFDGTVTLSISNNSSVQLQGNLTLNASSGLVTFSGLSIDLAGSYTIGAMSTGLFPATTSLINVSAGPAVQLVVTPADEPPSTIGAGDTFGFVVEAVDNFGNIDPTYNQTVTIATSPAVTLYGSPTATAQNGVATFSDLSIDSAGTYTIQASSGTLATGTTTSITVTAAALSKLIITAEPPSSTVAGGTFGLSVGGTDQFGNPLTTLSGTVLIALANSPGVTLYGTRSEPAQSGVATFSGLSINVAGSYQIQATSGSLTAATSSAIAVSTAPTAKLVIATEPSKSALAGQPFAVQPVIDVADQDGNIETSDNTTVVSVALASGDGLPEGTTSVTVKNGVATFVGLNEITAGTIALEFSGDGMTTGHSTNIVVSPAAPFRLAIQTQPSSAAPAGQPIGTQPVIYELDQYGNLESRDNSTVITASLSFGNGPLLGTTTAAVAGGVATFTNLAGSAVGTISLGFSGGGLSVGPSNNIVISPGPAAQLAILTQPIASVSAGNTLTDPIVVAEEDQYGNIVTGDNTTVVTAALHSGAGTLIGTTTATVSGGIASFNDLEDDTAGTLSLEFAAEGLPTVISNTSTVSPGPATLLKTIDTPPSGVIAGTAFGGFVVDVMDNYDNLVTSFDGPVTAALASGSAGTLSGTVTVTAVSGQATFDNLITETSGPIALTAASNASGTNLTSPPPDSIVVSPASVDHFDVITDFANPDVAGSTGSVTVTAEDQFGNVANVGQNQYLGTVNLRTADIQAAGLPASYTFTDDDNGTHTFTNVVLKTAGSQTITATDSADSATTGTSPAVDVVPATVNKFLVSPGFTNPDVAGTVGTVTVTAEDQFGNIVGSGPNQYVGTVDLDSSDAKAAGLSASHTFTASDAGSYTFAAVALKTAGLQTVTANDSTQTKILGSSTVSVTAAAAIQLVVTTPPPSSLSAGQSFTLGVSAEDTYGNVVPTFDGNVTVNLPGGAGTATTVQAKNGVATLTGLTATAAAQGESIQATASGLTAAVTLPFNVTLPAPAPTISSEQVAKMKLKNKKGKPTGKTALEFSLKYNTAMNPALAGLASNYQVETAVVKGTKKKTITYKPVAFTESYNQSTNTVTLTITGNQPFTSGGKIIINAAPPNGVSSAGGVLLNASDTDYNIGTKAKSITLS